MPDFTYVTKPVTVEAFEYALLDSPHTIALPGWLMPAISGGILKPSATVPDQWYCTTKNGDVLINKTDMLIRLDDGEIYPCDIEVFKKKYEKLPGAADR